jgi:CRISPR system Cascade subunit CasB
MSERSLSEIFTEGDDSSRVLVAWWRALDHNRGERASLRRAASPTVVVFRPSFHRLLGQLRTEGYPLNTDRAEAIATIAGLSAHVKSHAGGASFAVQLATPKSPGGRALVSGLRFRRLLAVSNRDELYPLLIRVVRLLDRSVNLVSLANAVFWWNDRNEKTKKDWAYTYYAKAPSEK